jgi:hypothetical protein
MGGPGGRDPLVGTPKGKSHSNWNTTSHILGK